MRRLLVAAALVTVTLGARRAEAAPTAEDAERARTFFNAGAQAYAAARYGDAARSFLQAYELSPRPQLAFSLAQAERKEFYASGDASYLRRAIQHYKEYVDATPSGGRRSEALESKADLEGRLAKLDPKDAAAATAVSVAVDKRKARVTVYSPTPGASASLDNGPAQVLPYFGDLPPGKHRIRVFADGFFEEEREVSGDVPGDQPLDLPLKERPSPVSVVLDRAGDVYIDGRIVATTPLSRPIDVPPGPHVISIAVVGKKPFSQEIELGRGKPLKLEPKLETSVQRIVAWSFLGAGAATIITGGVFGILALGQESRANGIAADRDVGNIAGERLLAYNRSIERRDDFRTVSVVTMSVGAAVALGGAFLFFVDKPSIPLLPPRSVEPAPRPKDTPIDITASPILGPGGTWGGALTATF